MPRPKKPLSEIINDPASAAQFDAFATELASEWYMQQLRDPNIADIRERAYVALQCDIKHLNERARSILYGDSAVRHAKFVQVTLLHSGTVLDQKTEGLIPPMIEEIEKIKWFEKPADAKPVRMLGDDKKKVKKAKEQVTDAVTAEPVSPVQLLEPEPEGDTMACGPAPKLTPAEKRKATMAKKRVDFQNMMAEKKTARENSAEA